MNKKVECISEILPRTTNFRILDLLINTAQWGLGSDSVPLTYKNYIEASDKKDLGFTYKTFDIYNNVNITTELNTYANLIFDTIQKFCRSYKLIKPTRYIWNYYNRGSEGTWHVDNGNDPEGDYITAIYNLNRSDGYLQIKQFDSGTEDARIYNSSPSEAIVFHSGLEHRGVGPSKFTGRFNLAMMMELK